MIRRCMATVFAFVLLISFSSGCFSSKKQDPFADIDYLTPQLQYASNWKQFSVKHPTGFWQVIKKEKWTLLYNNQDAPVQMVVDANRHYFGTPSNQKRVNRFIGALKMKNVSIISTESVTVAKVDALKTVVKGQIRFDFWDKFYVERMLTIHTFRHDGRSYLLGYISDLDNYEKYYKTYETLLENFKFYFGKNKTS